MLTGLPPFYNEDRDRLFKNIKNLKIDYPKFLSKNSVSLFKGIFIRDPEKRLGSGSQGADSIKFHPFFEKVDWNLVEKKQIKSPFKPKVMKDNEPIYISEDWKNMSPTDSDECESPSKDETSLFKGIY